MSQISGKFIVNNTVTLNKLNQGGATLRQAMVWTGSTWAPFTLQSAYQVTAIQSVASITPTTVTELISATLPVGTYRWIFRALAQSTAATTGLGFRIVPISASVTTIFGKFQIAQGVNGLSNNFGYDQLNAAINVTSASVDVINTDLLAFGEGIVNVSVAGTIGIQLRSETTNAVSIRPGSVLIVEAL